MKNYLLKSLSRPLWIFEKAYLWGRSALNLRQDDVILAFYPKTGSTWVRIFFFNLMSQNTNRDKTFSFDDVNDSMPEFANPSLFQPWSFPDFTRLVKTHRPYNFVLRNRRTILFTREPRDTMISYLHYANAKNEFGFSGDLAKLIGHPEMGLDSYFRFYRSWATRADLVIRYEDLRAEPLATFRILVNFIGLDVTDEQIVLALDASSIERTRAAQADSSDKFRGKFKEGFIFARSGKTGEGKEKFDDTCERLLAEKRVKYNFRLY